MDNLINKWKQTVENHNRKLSQLREESLGRSASKDRSLFMSRGDSNLNISSMSKLPPKTELKNQRLIESKDSDEDEKQQALPPKSNKKENKENKAPLVDLGQCDQEFVQQSIDQLIAVYPETKLKSKKAAKLRDLISTHYEVQFRQLQKLQREIKTREAEKKEHLHSNEATSKKIGDLETKLQESDRERQKARQERDDLLRQLQTQSGESESKQNQAQVMQMLRRTQETLEVANQKLEQMFLENKKRFKEREEVWEQELAALK